MNVIEFAWMAGALLLLSWGLGGMRNRLFQHLSQQHDSQQEIPQWAIPQRASLPPVIIPTMRTQLLMYGLLVGITAALMGGLSGGWDWRTGLLAVGLMLPLNFFGLLFLRETMVAMREYRRLSWQLLTHYPIWVLMVLVATVELSFLNWAKEVNPYFMTPFWLFSVGYALSLFGMGCFLGLYPIDLSSMRDLQPGLLGVVVLDAALAVLISGVMLAGLLVVIYS